MDDLVQWLRAQLDEDERDIRNEGGITERCDSTWHWDEGRCLREVEAKRRILDEYEKALDRRRLFRDDVASAGALLQMVAVVKLLALPFADREGFREEWRP